MEVQLKSQTPTAVAAGAVDYHGIVVDAVSKRLREKEAYTEGPDEVVEKIGMLALEQSKRFYTCFKRPPPNPFFSFPWCPPRLSLYGCVLNTGTTTS